MNLLITFDRFRDSSFGSEIFFILENTIESFGRAWMLKVFPGPCARFQVPASSESEWLGH